MVFNNNLLLGAAGAAGGGYTIPYSARFNSADSSYMYRTLAGDGSTTTTTVSCWVKRNKLGTAQGIISGYYAAGGPAEACLRFNSSDQIQYFDNNGISLGDFVTNAVFRDVSKPYHIVFIRDTTNGTAASRLRLIVNGTEITSWASRTDPTASEATLYFMRAAYPQRIGHTNSSPNYSNFTLSEFHLIDGLVKEASEFGETDAVTGQWVPKAYTGTYGSEGFYLDFADSGALGTDVSGNANTFTTSGLTSADQLTDTPTDNFPTLNPLATGMAATLSDGNLAFSFGSDDGAPATFATGSTGSYRFRVNITTLGAQAAIAILTPAAYDAITNWGNINLGAGSGQYAYRSNGDKFSGNSAVAYGASFTSSDYVEAEYDADAGTLVFYKNGTTQGTAYTGLSGPMFFAISRNASGGTAVIGTVDFGQLGTVGDTNVLSTATLPDPTIADPSAYFQATAYAGSASALEVNQSGNSTFQPDFIWIKQRTDAGTNHQLVDAVRGENLRLESDNTDAEGDVGAGGITSFDADGFSVGTNSNYNAASKNFIAWQWKADNTSGSSNTDGSITSTVSANTTSGFSIGTYTGTGGNDTVGHGLGVAPALVIIKERTGTYNGGWYTYHESTGATGYLRLQTTAAFAADSTFMNDTAPTSSVFSLGTNLGPNGTTTYVFYAFAEVDGFSKFGSYVGNASADGPFIDCGFRPAFVMYKRTDSADNWVIKDDVRSNYNPNNLRIYPNQSAAEDTSVNGAIDIVSNGFKVRSDDTIVNASGGTYIYAAFARSPFKTANAR